MKRIIALAICLLLLAGCGAVGMDEPVEPRLIAEWPENDISLYYVREGTVLLRHGTEEATFSGWGKPWLDFDYSPGMAYYDIDGNGLNELIIKAQTTRGETFSDELHVITLEAQPWVDHVLRAEDIAAMAPGIAVDYVMFILGGGDIALRIGSYGLYGDHHTEVSFDGERFHLGEITFVAGA